MAFPAIRLHQLYSIDFYEQIRILFENLKMVNATALEKIIKEKPNNIVVVPNLFQIDLMHNVIILVGHKINDTTYMINHAGGGDTIRISYTCSNETIWKGIEYLYHMHTNLVQ